MNVWLTLMVGAGIGLAIFIAYRQRLRRSIAMGKPASLGIWHSPAHPAEERLKDWIALSCECLWETDADLRLIYLSPQFETIARLPAKLLLGTSLLEIGQQREAAESDHLAWQTHAEDLKAHRAFEPYRYRFTNGNGDQIHLSVAGKPIFDDKGNFRGYRGTATDITATVEAQRLADSAQKRLEEALAKVPQGFALFDEHERLVYYNPQYRNMFPEMHGRLEKGQKFEDLLRHAGWQRLLHGEGEAWERWTNQRLVQFRDPAPKVFDEARPDGRVYRAIERKTPSGATVTIFTDITDLQAHARALTVLVSSRAAGQTFLHAAAEAIATGMGYRWGAVGRIRGNDVVHLQAIWERGRGILPDITYNLANTPCAQILQQGGHLCIPSDASVLYPDSQVLSELKISAYQGEAFFDRDGKVMGFVCAFDGKADPEAAEKHHLLHLIANWVGIETQRLEAERDLRAAKDEAEAASRAKTDFLANMSHELRTPLNAVIGFAEMMRREYYGILGHDKYREYASDIVQSGNHLLALINDVLDVARTGAGKMVLHDSQIDCFDLVESCLRLMEPRIQKANIRIHNNVATDLPPIVADERRMRQVLLNVISNAVKFTPSGGSISITANLDRDRGCIFMVQDTGIGIAAEDISKVMQPFGQVDNVFSRRTEGAGLGLPLSRSLIELHGGTINVESHLGQGTTVTITLPANRIMASAA